MMRNKRAVFLTVLLTAGMLAGCGSSGAGSSLGGIRTDRYVTLGEYKGLQVSVDPIVVEDSEVEELVSSAYSSYLTAETGGITDRAVEVGDTVNIDYEGKQDGVAFDRGTAQGDTLTIGSDSFIDGFEDGLVGVMPGETVDLNLKFPENYGGDMAGQEVVFTVTVNFIVPEQMEDTVVAAMGIDGVDTVEGLRQYAYDYLYSRYLESYSTELENAVLDAFMNSCVFKKDPPKSVVEKYEDMAREGITQQAESYGMEAEDFVRYYYDGKDLETFLQEYSAEAARQDIALQAVANRENLTMDDGELDATLQEYAANAGYDTVEEFMGTNTKEDYRDYLVCERTLQFLIENAVVN